MIDDLPPLSALARGFRPGIYRHYKGGLYHALLVGRSSEAREEESVVYRSLEKGSVWIRPLAMFLEDVKTADYEGPRFAWVREADWDIPDQIR